MKPTNLNPWIFFLLLCSCLVIIEARSHTQTVIAAQERTDELVSAVNDFPGAALQGALQH